MSPPTGIVILGNTGSGKTTLASALATRWDLRHLDLDTVVFDPDTVARMRSDADIAARLDAFVATHDRWVAEGSYARWARHLSAAAEALVFLDPGVEVCHGNQRRRPWEPHKYADPAEQERRRAFLAEWTARYPDRPDQFGRDAHRAVVAVFTGPTVQVGPVADPVAHVVAHLR